ncbi:hypothetical protein PR202_ga13520 [Eleusine coracana subsp. coracana]|uniref:ABC transporter B family member 25 n=1 Tax=Eleusine coracana subsp. coracana TaxID=191504 RepID=A0AAV5CEZ4_ELECO|nr:hypothetical protein PR202_ga13520 [Eleusine coracana subsp. coracana]
MAFSPRTPWSRSRKPDVYSTVVVHGDDDEDPRGGGRPAPGVEDDEEEEDPSSLPPLLQRLPKDFGGASFDDDDDPYSSDPDDASLSATVVVKRSAPASTSAYSRSPFLDLRRSSPRASEDDPYSTFVVHSTSRSGGSPREFASGTFIRRSGGSTSPRESVSGTFIRRTGRPSSPRESISGTFIRRTGSPSSPAESYSGTFIRHTGSDSSPRESGPGGGGGFGSSFWTPAVEQLEERRQPSPLMQEQLRRKPSVSSVPESITREDPSTKYELLHELGKGSYGAVYKARDLRTQELVAVKIISLTEGEEGYEDIRGEIEMLQQCSHPNVVRYFGSYQGEEYLWGLAYLHSIFKVHRDIKGGNILLTEQGEVKLVHWYSALDGTRGHASKIAVHPMRVIFMISSEPAPMLRGQGEVSRSIKRSLLFHDFIAKCLTKDPRLRPAASEMLKHKFIEKCNTGASKMLAKIKEAKKIRDTLAAENDLSSPDNIVQDATVRINGNYGETVPANPQEQTKHETYNGGLGGSFDRAENTADSDANKEQDLDERPDIQELKSILPSTGTVKKHMGVDGTMARNDNQLNSSSPGFANTMTKLNSSPSRKAFSVQDKLWSIYAAGNTVPIPFLKAIDVSPLSLVSEHVAGNGLAGSSTSDALEAVRELFSGDGQAKKGRKGQNEVPLPPGVHQRLTTSPTLMNLAQALAYHKTCYEDMPLQDSQATQEQQTIQNLCDTLRTILSPAPEPVRGRPLPPPAGEASAAAAAVMGKNMRIKTAPKPNRVPLLHNGETSTVTSDLEEGSNVQAANVGFCRVFKLAKHDAGKLVLATMALLVASLSNILVEIAFFDVTRTGELLSRLSEDTQIIKNAATTNLSEALRNITTTAIGLGFMFSTSWKLTLLALVIVPVISVAVRRFGRFLRELSHQTQAAAAVASSIAEESFGAIRTVRSFAQEPHEISRYGEKVDETLKLGLKQAKVVGMFSGGLNAASTLSVVIVVIYGANLTINGYMTTGSLTSFILYSLTVGSSVSALSGLYTTVMKASGASRRVFQLLDRVSSMEKSGDKCPMNENDGEVELDDVWFSYPSRPSHMILKGINLKLAPGSKVALVGPSGGGKVSIVSQEPVLFNCSIEENIAYGLEGKASSADVENAAKMANAHNFISSFPDQYKTVVGERGIRLSGGQKQRIAIARALLMNPRVLLLDEATSALDAESEYLVQDAMDSLMKGRTVLVIAHRLSTVKSADTVAVVSDGQIVERGTHDELLSRDGIYTALVKRQLQGPKFEATSSIRETGEIEVAEPSSND